MDVHQKSRPYRKRRRAELEQHTTRRITEATVALHREVGPAKTTISAVAERAGVQRLTVYRHFSDERQLVHACSAHWSAEHPPPDPSPWPEIADPEQRLRRALEAFYAYYASDEAMIGNVLRDAPSMPALAETIAGFPDYLAAVVEVLAAGWAARGRRRELLLAAIGHVLDFETWRSLERRQGLDRARAIALAVGMVRAAAAR